MSGGKLDYISFNLNQAIEGIEEYLDDDSYKISSYQKFRYWDFVYHLKLVSEALHKVEWEMSGDTSWPSSEGAIREVID
jgi:hypothetical protein